jgi:H+/Cl- antiporter ClcA
MSTFTLTVLKQLYEGDTHIKLINSGNVKLASVGELNIYVDTLFASAVIGILGGLVGSIFIRVNTFVNIIRKKILTTNIRRVLEASLLIGITVTCFFVSSLFQDTCV